jgi:bifunctional non-homologous end joining protein LigD
VSAPLHWDEVNDRLNISDFNMHNMKDRLKREGDLFAGVLGKGVDLHTALHLLSGLV